VPTRGVNSAHHQAVRSPGTGVVVHAYAADGVIAGIEVPDLSFCLGGQCHPEFKVDPFDIRIFEALIAAARLR
ncbi:MAG: gamma-glutamyl-gamma-aminobutyrate hydrolase family protein, partial [Candidatus Nucleicultricaceae bacterium]